MRPWAKRLLLALAIPAGLYLLLYLLPANLVLRSPGLFNRSPERFRIGWGSAWTLLPGEVEVRKLRIDGGNPRLRWSLAVDEGRGRLDLTALLGRELHLRGFEGKGVEARLIREVAAAGGPSTPRKGPRRRPWTVRLEGVQLTGVRVLDAGPLRLEGNGRAAGAFRLVIGKETQLDLQSVEMDRGRLFANGKPAAENVSLRAGLHLGPYAPRRHPGMAGLDFLSGSFDLSGKGPGPGRLALHLKVERGALQPGSRAEIAPVRQGSAIVVTASVVSGELRLAADMKRFALRRSGGLPPLLESGVLRVTAATPEVRLSRLLAAGRSLRSRAGLAGMEWTLQGDMRAERLRLTLPGRSASLQISADRATGRIDLPALLRQELRLDGLRAEGAHLRLTRGEPAPKTEGAPGRRRWSARLSDVRVEGDGEVALNDFRLDGNLVAAGTLSWSGGALAMEPASVAFSGGRLQSRGRTVAHGLGLQGEVRLAPFVPGQVRGLEILRLVSGKAKVEGSIASLGFLQPYLEKASWLTLDGNGSLRADLALDRGRLLPGSGFSVKPAQLRTEFLLSRATGSAEMTGSVVKTKRGGELDIRVLFGRFEVAGREPRGARSHIRGRGLRVSLATPGLDLARPGKEIRARIDLPSAEVNDLTFYNGYLPPSSGLEIVSGTGRLSFWLEMDTAAGPAGRGEMSLQSRAVVVRLNDLELAGVLDLKTVLASQDLRKLQFAIGGTRLSLDRVALREIGSDAETAGSPPANWWARLELVRVSMDLARPLSLAGSVRLSMKDSGLLLSLFSRRKRYLAWFQNLLTVEDIQAQGDLRLGQGALVLDPFVATGSGIELRSRLRLSRAARRGCLFIRHGRKSVGIELQGAERDYKLLRPLKWFQSCPAP